MKGHIIRLAEYSEYGKTDTVVLTLALNKTEARRILENLTDVTYDAPAVVRQLYSAMCAIEDGEQAIKLYNKAEPD